MNRRIINPVTGTAYELRNRSSKAGVKPQPKGLWSASRKEMKPEEMKPEEILAYVKDYLEETKIWEEEYLRIRYGSKWSQYIRAHVGIGYEICEELLDKITELERQPDISNTGRECIEEINARRRLCNAILAINRHCSKHCPEQVCGRCTLKAFSDVAIGKPLDYETNSKSPRRDLNITDQKGGADMSESN